MTTSFLGIPVDGDIVRGSHRKEQRPLEDLAPLMQAVLDDDGIACFGWTQYTPYFNDGEECIFSAGTVWVARHEDVPDIGSYALDVGFGGRLGEYEGGNWQLDETGCRALVGAEYKGPDQARYDRCIRLNNAIESGAFDDVLLAAFGDHAEITIRRDGITVEFYEHD